MAESQGGGNTAQFLELAKCEGLINGSNGEQKIQQLDSFFERSVCGVFGNQSRPVKATNRFFFNDRHQYFERFRIEVPAHTQLYPDLVQFSRIDLAIRLGNDPHETAKQTQAARLRRDA